MRARPRVLAFGVFDGIHPGHLAFLAQAKRLGGALMVVVARDAAVTTAKNRKPSIPERARVRLVAAMRSVDRAVLGDPPGRYGACVRRLKPDVIAVGYDQPCDIPVYRAELTAMGLPRTRVVRVRGYKPSHYHSSILTAREGRRQ